MLSQQEKNRYDRHLILDQVGESGQEKLKAARVLVIGAGGLGCPVLQYLTAAGVGTIGVIDYDYVDESNLQRQILFTINDIGHNKAVVAAERLKKLNPFVNFEVHELKLEPSNALQFIQQYDLVIDGTDNFSTRYMVSDACVILDKPLVYGSIFKFQGQVSVFIYKGGPSYRCLFPNPPEEGTVPNCSEIGVLGVLPGIIGCQQANEAIKIIVGIGEPLSGKLMVYDSLNARTSVINIARNEGEIEKVKAMRNQFSKTDYDLFCGIKGEQEDDISLDKFKTLIMNNVPVLDVREVHEEPKLFRPNVIHAPLSEFEDHIQEIPKDKPVVVVCRSGKRSRMIIEQLKEKYHFTNLLNLKEGLMNYGG